MLLTVEDYERLAERAAFVEVGRLLLGPSRQAHTNEEAWTLSTARSLLARPRPTPSVSTPSGPEQAKTVRPER